MTGKEGEFILWGMELETNDFSYPLGLDAGSSFSYGVKNALEIESYAKGLKVIHEWSYVEDPDVRPRILKYLGLSRTQWTITAAINSRE